MKTVFVNQIRERDWVDAPFLVREKILAMAKNGRPYLTLKLMDRTGEVEGKIWDQVDELSACFDKNDFVKIAAKASVYLGKMQLVIQQLTPLHETDIDLGDYLPTTHRSIAEMVAELQALVTSLSDQPLRSLMESLLDDPVFMRRYSQAPAAKSMHHVYLGGLLEHSLAVAALAEDICRRYPGLDRDLLLVGALLHDVGKIDELSYDRSFQYTDAGKLLGHIMIGVELINQKIRSIERFPERTALLLKHLMLSHHGQYEYGSPKRPKTMEAVILNFLDDLDSKINGVRSHIEREPDRESSWTEYHRLYDRYFYKGEGETPALAIAAEKAPTVANDRPDRQQKRSRFSNTLEDQLRVKRHGLFAGPASEDENEA